MARQKTFSYEASLQPEQFEKLLQHFDEDREQAGSKYEDLRRKLMRYFAWNDCFPEEELADMTFDRVSSKLATERIHNIVAFIWGVAKNIKREFYKRQPPINIEDLPSDKIPHTGHPELAIIQDTEAERRRYCLQACIQALTNLDRELFLQYEYYAVKTGKMDVLTARLKITKGALRTRAHRIRHRIEACTAKCLHSEMSTKIMGARSILPNNGQ